MSERRMLSNYLDAREVFLADPSPQNEGIVIQAYAEFARCFAPDQAAELISLCCRHFARYVEDRRQAA